MSGPISPWLVATLSCTLVAQSLAAMPGECVTDREGTKTCPAADVACMADIFGQVLCTQPKGRIFQDQYGKAVCAVGICASDVNGQLRCASTANGTVALDPNRIVVCSDKCVKASSTLCRAPKAPPAKAPPKK